MEQPKAARPNSDSPIPALIFATEEAGQRIAALTVLDRLVVAIHRAGVGPITIVSEGPLPELKRSRALGISVEVAEVAPRVEGRVLVADGNVLVQAADVRRCVERGGRLVGRDGVAAGIGELLPIGVFENAAASMLKSIFGFGPCVGFVEEALAGARRIEAAGVAHLVTDKKAARAAEKSLWASLTSSSDGFVDKMFNRPCGRWLSKVLVFTPVTPNMVSIASIIIGVVSALFFAQGEYASAVLGGILFQLSAMIDCVDGDIARVLFKESPLGKWIDLAGDQIVHISVIAGIALGVARTGQGNEALWLGVSAVVGALISFVVVLRGLRQASDARGLLKRIIDAASNRDFSVLVLFLACVQKLNWFLWMSAIGSHFFWITALLLQLSKKPDGRASR